MTFKCCNFLDLFSTPIDLKLVDRAKYAMAEINSKRKYTTTVVEVYVLQNTQKLVILRGRFVYRGWYRNI